MISLSSPPFSVESDGLAPRPAQEGTPFSRAYTDRAIQRRMGEASEIANAALRPPRDWGLWTPGTVFGAKISLLLEFSSTVLYCIVLC